MSEERFTPGPWSIDNNDARDGAQAVLSDANGCIVAETYALDRPGDCEANARLIAAAPDMLEALTMALPYVESCENDDTYKPMAVKFRVKLMRVAIAKATGEAS